MSDRTNVPGDWVNLAACAEIDPDMWFADKDGGKNARTKAARKVCGGCEVRTQCLEFAMKQEYELLGVWGGLTAFERKRLRRKAA